MEYTKPTLTYSQQADLIISRGLVADREQLIYHLKNINYYRLSGYLFPFRNPDDTYKAGTTLDFVLQHYLFDRQLRVLVLDAIEKIEVAVRTSTAYAFTNIHGPFGHLDYNNLRNLTREDHQTWLDSLETETKRSREKFVDHFLKKYGDRHSYLPLWMAVEILTFGAMLKLFSGMNDSLKKTVAADYKIPDIVFHSWLVSLNVIRNICAHHGRLWNKELGCEPRLPSERKYPEWHVPVEIPKNRIFVVLTILKYMISIISPECTWHNRVRILLNENPLISKKSMGFPDNWDQSPLWK